MGTAPLATVFWGNDEATALATVEAALAAGIRWFDTAPLYGLGESEVRLGRALADVDPSVAAEVHVATKVGRLLAGPGAATGDGERTIADDVSRDGTRRSLDGSLQRLGRSFVDVAHVHDPDDHVDDALRTCIPALRDLQAEGVVGAVSVGTNSAAVALRFVTADAVDQVMVAGRLTLLDRSALDELVGACGDRGIAIWAAGVFNSGVLARPGHGSWFDYAPADPAVVARAKELAATAARHHVDLKAAAMAFPLRFAPVTAAVVGMATPSEVTEDVALWEHAIPDPLWDDLDQLVRSA
jgi:D-threo-aldose 1-dehydrogenase